MNYMGAISWLVKVLFIVSLPLLFISIGFRVVTNSEWFYERGFDTYNVSRVTGIERPELVRSAKGIITYLNSVEEPFSLQVEKDGKMITLFNERETQHLKDVKDLYLLSNRIGEVTGLYVLAYALVLASMSMKTAPRKLATLAFAGSTLILVVIILLVVGSLIDFESLFYEFHVLSFSNDLWMLDPSKDYMIMMFPEGFWIDFSFAVTAITAVQALVVGGVSYVYLGKRGRSVAAGVRLAPH